MRSKAKQVRQILDIPARRLPAPRILITMDLEEETYEREMRPILAVIARHQVPLTLFVNNRPMGGGDNRRLIAEIESFFNEARIPLEIASHSMDHRDLRSMALTEVAAKIEESLREFRRWGIPVRGFRAPYLGVEGVYGDLLTLITADGGLLEYDSSLFYEANLATSLFHALTRKKAPHKIGRIWELPISCLDDYHMLKKGNLGTSFAYHYWTAEVRLWMGALNYFMALFHPYIMGGHLELLDRFLNHCRRRFSPAAFCRCQDIVDELETGFSGAGPAFTTNVQAVAQNRSVLRQAQHERGSQMISTRTRSP